MIRQAAAVVVVLLLSPSWVTAQGTELTVNVASASVHKSPSNASPVIGQVARGAKLAVTREVGDWVKVAYPSAADGVGYVRMSMGSDGDRGRRLHGADPGAPRRARTRSPTQPAPAWRHRRGRAGPDRKSPAGSHTAPSASGTSHKFGLGAHLGGPSFGIGGSARAWAHGGSACSSSSRDTRSRVQSISER